MRVKLEDIVEGMEMQSDDNRSFLNLDTGEIVHVSHEALLIAEDSEDYEHLSEKKHGKKHGDGSSVPHKYIFFFAIQP